MDLGIFSIYDNKAEAFIPPFYAGQEKVARRIFGDCCVDPTHAFCRNPKDYDLYFLGVFDDQNGQIYLGGKAEDKDRECPKFIINGLTSLRLRKDELIEIEGGK